MKKRFLIPPQVMDFIERGAALAISISGGKDSQALLHEVVRWFRAQGFSNHLFAIHADLGRAEWKGTTEFVQQLCARYEVPLVIVQREQDGEKIDLVTGWQNRMEAVKGRNIPHWSGAQARYCTDLFKTKPVNEYLKQFDLVVSIEGIRWEESLSRSKKPRVEKRKDMKRKALTWNAICDYTMADVWATGGQSFETLEQARKIYRETGEVPDWWTFSRPYAMGNSRHSCAMCVLSNRGDLENGILHNPELADEISKMEEESGFTFRIGKSVAQIRQQSCQKTQVPIF